MKLLYFGRGYLEFPYVSTLITPFQIKKKKLLENMLLLIQWGIIINGRYLPVPLPVTTTVLFFLIYFCKCFYYVSGSLILTIAVFFQNF